MTPALDPDQRSDFQPLAITDPDLYPVKCGIITPLVRTQSKSEADLLALPPTQDINFGGFDLQDCISKIVFDRLSRGVGLNIGWPPGSAARLFSLPDPEQIHLNCFSSATGMDGQLSLWERQS